MAQSVRALPGGVGLDDVGQTARPLRCERTSVTRLEGAKASDDHRGLIDETVKKLAPELMDGVTDFIASKTSREVGR